MIINQTFMYHTAQMQLKNSYKIFNKPTQANHHDSIYYCEHHYFSIVFTVT